MASKTGIATLALSLLAPLVAAQAQTQAILTSGNTQLPQCAQQCPLLIQASQACSGTTSAPQSAWICFCQSGYLSAPVNLKTTATGVCDSVCSGSDLQAVSTWYNTECGSDNGASEHTGTGAASSSAASSAGAPTSTQSGGAAASSSASSSSDSSSGSGSSSSSQPQDWWSGHYQWIIMIIVLAILLPLVGFLGHWLKRRHERRRDLNRNGFNAGITSRSGPVGQSNDNDSGAVSAVGMAGSGRDSPARTRDAYMPYGYGYNRSESAMGANSALGRGDTPDLEKEHPVETPEQAKTRPKQRVLVRERSRQDGGEGEKRSRY